MNGEMPISWESPVYTGNTNLVTYEFLMGHSTGTSAADRHFDVALNGQKLFTITTLMKSKGAYTLAHYDEQGIGYTFFLKEFDVNQDGFGKLLITVPSTFVKQKAHFSITGQNENSRDWLMIFMYQKGLKVIAQPTSLVTRETEKRQLNLFIDNPYTGTTPLIVKTAMGTFPAELKAGYNKLGIPIYSPGFTGNDNLQLIFNGKDTVYKLIQLLPVRNFVFYIIHHSHNDIGYSNLQPEVEKIQTQNIRDALHWINANKATDEKPFWHIESLWAVENFLRIASVEEEKQFVQAVKEGQLVLSANYANIMSGLCQPEEQNWVLEYAKYLEKKYGLRIRNAMITDIPGITRSGLLSYVNNNIPWLSLGPNYVESLPDKGDRVGGIIREQGDKIFYWKPDSASSKKLLVWTAGKGYSLFHGIPDAVKQQSWEQRLSDYCMELSAKNYPFDMVQLRYTKNADNGPVDTQLHQFVKQWNERYLSPKLKISSVDNLFPEFEKQYGKNLPVQTGEISPYWEDGAYSTAIEEMENRELVLKTIAMESVAKKTNQFTTLQPLFYLLHKNIIMFHEHTWGSWCSISDPELFFTTEQWRIKKQFLDSARYYYGQLSALLKYNYRVTPAQTKSNLQIQDIIANTQYGGLQTILVNGNNMVSDSSYDFFEPVYLLGINPAKKIRSEKVVVSILQNGPVKKIIKVSGSLPSIPSYTVIYTLFKKEGRITCHFSFDKLIEKEKESLHIAFPFSFIKPVIQYNSGNSRVRFNKDQLPGSNKEFVCVERDIQVMGNTITASLSSPLFNMYEVGTIIDENKTNGVKTWKKENNNTSSLFLYVFNNYWHTNFKAWQEGHFDFEIELKFNKRGN